jgi:hypothetical protein
MERSLVGRRNGKKVDDFVGKGGVFANKGGRSTVVRERWWHFDALRVVGGGKVMWVDPFSMMAMVSGLVGYGARCGMFLNMSGRFGVSGECHRRCWCWLAVFAEECGEVGGVGVGVWSLRIASQCLFKTDSITRFVETLIQSPS